MHYFLGFLKFQACTHIIVQMNYKQLTAGCTNIWKRSPRQKKKKRKKRKLPLLFLSKNKANYILMQQYNQRSVHLIKSYWYFLTKYIDGKLVRQDQPKFPRKRDCGQPSAQAQCCRALSMPVQFYHHPLSPLLSHQFINVPRTHNSKTASKLVLEPRPLNPLAGSELPGGDGVLTVHDTVQTCSLNMKHKLLYFAP